MLNLLRAEILKQSKIGIIRVITFAPLVVCLVLSLLMLMLKAFGADLGTSPSRVGSGTVELGSGPVALASSIVLTGFASLFALAMVIVAGFIVSNEYSWSTIKMIATREASRPRIILAKAYFMGLYAALLAAIFIFGWLFYSLVLKLVFGAPLGLNSDDIDAIGKGLKFIIVAFFFYLIWSLLSIALAVRFKSVVVAVIIYVVYSIIDNVASSLGTSALNGRLGTNFPNWLEPFINLSKLIAPFLLNTNFARLSAAPGSPNFVESISPVQSFLVLVGWGVLFVLLAIYVFQKRDITD